MDEQLAAIYGTGQPEMDESDLEKTAAAELLVKLAEEQGVDLNAFSDEEVGEMLNDLYGGGIYHYAEDAEAETEDPAKKKKKEAEEEEGEAEEKVAEADYLGRIMAHSMVQELNHIEKEAGKLEAVKGAVGQVGQYIKGRPAAYKQAIKNVSQARAGRNAAGMKLSPEKIKGRYTSALKGVAPELGAGGAVAAGLGGRAIYKSRKAKAEADMNKAASALEALAEERAFEMAKEAGYIDDEGNYLVDVGDYNYEEQIKEASALEYEIERRALEICEAEGIPVEWNE
jgi:hypothetical protein